MEIEHKDFDSVEDAIRYVFKTGKAVVGNVKSRDLPDVVKISFWRRLKNWFRSVIEM